MKRYCNHIKKNLECDNNNVSNTIPCSKRQTEIVRLKDSNQNHYCGPTTAFKQHDISMATASLYSHVNSNPISTNLENPVVTGHGYAYPSQEQKLLMRVDSVFM